MSIKMNMPRQAILSVMATVVLAGCTGMPAPFETAAAITPPSVVTTLDPVSQSLLAAAERTSTALDRLSLVEQTRTPVPDPGRVSQAPPGLDRKANIDWNGPLAPLPLPPYSAPTPKAALAANTAVQEPPPPIITDADLDDDGYVAAQGPSPGPYGC